MSYIWNCVLEKLPIAASRVLGIEDISVLDLIKANKIRVAPTPDPKLGDFGIAIHTLLKNFDRDKWSEIGGVLAGELFNLVKGDCRVEKIEFVNGYLNVTVDYIHIFHELAEGFLGNRVLRDLGSIGNGVKVIVEHTSANPVHPLHIGSGRNSVLGDTYARLLKKLGFNVETRFYVNDLGRQVAVLVYGVKLVEENGVKPPVEVKIDHWYGVIYALTNILIETSRLQEAIKNKVNEFIEATKNLCVLCRENKFENPSAEFCIEVCSVAWRENYKIDALTHAKRIYRLLGSIKKPGAHPLLMQILGILRELREVFSEYKKYLSAEYKLRVQYPDIYAALKTGIKDYRTAEEEISRIMNSAERGDPETLSSIRKIVEQMIYGFTESLSKLDIKFNGFDFESNTVIVKTAHEIVEQLLSRGYARIISGGAVEINLDDLAKHNEYIKQLFHPDVAGRFILRRSDGTTLYVTRDIAYTLLKFKEFGASRVYNVIAVEQAREQKQIKAILALLGYRNEAENLVHFAYEMVHLKGMRMSGRRGIYYTMDELLTDMKLYMLKKYLEREKPGDVERALDIAEKLAVSNVRALLLSVDPGKVLVFDPVKLGEFEHGIIIQYAFVRACNIIRNLWSLDFLENPRQIVELAYDTSRRVKDIEFTLEEKRLLENLLNYSRVLKTAYEEMAPNKILEYALNLSLDFDKFYEKCPVIAEKDELRRSMRAVLTVMFLVAMSELMDILGFPKLARM